MESSGSTKPSAQSTADAVTNAQQAETIALNRYRSGLVSYLDVIYAQTALLANQRTATQISGQRMVATVVLIKALGGGWLGVLAQPGTNPIPGARSRSRSMNAGCLKSYNWMIVRTGGLWSFSGLPTA
jgi:outer membrane efflux protein